MATVLDAFQAAVALFEREDVPYAVIGGIAAGLQGRPRFTEDIDVLVRVARARIPDLARAAKDAGFDADPELAATQWAASGFFRIWFGRGKGRIAVDLMTSGSDYLRDVIARAEPRRFCGLDVRVATAEDVVLLKLMAWREKDLADVRDIVAVTGDRLDRAYLETWTRWLEARNEAFAAVPERLAAMLEGRPAPPPAF